MEADMQHDDSDNEYQQGEGMGEDLDFNDAVLWGADAEVEAGTDDEDDVHEMESDDDDDEHEPDAHFGNQDAPLNADGRHLHVWNLRGQLGALCVLAIRLSVLQRSNLSSDSCSLGNQGC
jgi:hypothetical protein